jgi:hypothetical protein
MARPEQAAGAEREWGPWSRRDEGGYRRLARYANADVGELTRLRLWVEGAFYERSSDSRALLGKVYDALLTAVTGTARGAPASGPGTTPAATTARREAAGTRPGDAPR